MPADFVNPGRYWTPAPAEAPQESDAPALTEHNTGLGHNLLPLAHCRPKRACPAPARFTGEGPQLAPPVRRCQLIRVLDALHQKGPVKRRCT